ncbi:MAG: FAD binding domain-containing protein, partial [Pseudomonadota bacterium]
LRTLTVSAAGITAGATVTLADLMPPLTALYPAFTSMLKRWASPPIRNAATIGGNIANGSPIGDSMPALMAVGATVTLQRGDALRTLPLEDLYHDYMVNDLQDGEFVRTVTIPAPTAEQHTACYKISKRFDQDISALCAGFSVTLADGAIRTVRLAYGGLAGTVKRAHQAEAALLGQPLNQGAIGAAQTALAEDFAPLSDMRATDHYRRTVAANLLQRFLLDITASGETDVYQYGR